MLFEQRCYTLKPGTTTAFWQAQVERGFELVEPIQQRLVGYFSNVSGPVDQVTHLYRYDSFDDWENRLHGLYAVSALQPYFRSVRALMTAQQNQFFAVAPVAQLNPLWGQGRDWIPEQRAPILPGAAPGSLVAKDLDLALGIARESGLQLALTETVRTYLTQLKAAGHDETEVTVLAEHAGHAFTNPRRES